MKVTKVVHKKFYVESWVYIETNIWGSLLFKRFSATDWKLDDESISILSIESLEEAYQIYLKELEEKEPSMKVIKVGYGSTGFEGWPYLRVQVKINDNYFEYRRYSAEEWHIQGKCVTVKEKDKLEEAHQTYSKEQAHIRKKIMKDFKDADHRKSTSGEKDAIALIDAMLNSILCDVKEMAEVYNIPMPELSDIECRHVAVQCPFSFETVRGWFPVKNDWTGLYGGLLKDDFLHGYDKYNKGGWYGGSTDSGAYINKSDEPTTTIICCRDNAPQETLSLYTGMKKEVFDNFITPMTKTFGETPWILNSTHLLTLNGMDAAIQPHTAKSLYKKLIDIMKLGLLCGGCNNVIVSYYHRTKYNAE